MPAIAANGIQLEYERFGNPDDAALLLVMGLGAQMIFWDEEFCEGLAARGRHVIRFDNRDCGLSTKIDHLGVPDMRELHRRHRDRQAAAAPYLLPTWPTTPPRCSTHSTSTPHTSSARRWAA